MDIVPEDLLKAVGDAARRAADAAGQIQEQRVLTVHLDLQLPELDMDAQRGGGVAEEEVLGILVVDEKALFIGLGLLPSAGHGLAVITGIFLHDDALAPEQILFPLLRVAGHMDDGLKAETGGHAADADPEVSGGADLDLVLSEEGPELVGVELCVIVHGMQHAGVHGQGLRDLQDLVDPAAGLHGTGDGKPGIVL